MPIEAVTYVGDLIITNPTGGDQRYEGDDHIRNIKKALRNSFPNITGAVTPTVAEFNTLVGVTSSVQSQLNALTTSTPMYGVLAGTNTYTVTVVPSIVTYTVGAAYRFLCANSNTSPAPTIALNGLAPLTVTKNGGEVLSTGDMPSGGIVEVIVTASGLVLLNPVFANLRTGMLQPTFEAAAPTGWYMLDDLSIGSAASGATGRANADTQALYTLIWNNITDTYAPVATGRGATAAEDFAANKAMTLPKTLGRALGIAGSGAGLTARGLGQTVGTETHQLTESEMPSHEHQEKGVASGDGVTTAELMEYKSGAAAVDGDIKTLNYYQVGGGAATSAPLMTTSIGGDAAHNNMQPTSFINMLIKL